MSATSRVPASASTSMGRLSQSTKPLAVDLAGLGPKPQRVRLATWQPVHVRMLLAAGPAHSAGSRVAGGRAVHRPSDPQGLPPANVSVGEAIYSVPHQLIGEHVWVRAEAEQLVVVLIDSDQAPREVARTR